MHGRERIVRERFAEQTCTHCGALYPADGVIVLARRRSTWMVMATCIRCQQRGLFVVSFPEPHRVDGETGEHLLQAQIDTPSILPNSFLPASPESTSQKRVDSPAAEEPDASILDSLARPVTVNDVNQMHEFLATFNGDFSTLFARTHPKSPDDSSAS